MDGRDRTTITRQEGREGKYIVQTGIFTPQRQASGAESRVDIDSGKGPVYVSHCQLENPHPIAKEDATRERHGVRCASLRYMHCNIVYILDPVWLVRIPIMKLMEGHNSCSLGI